MASIGSLLVFGNGKRCYVRVETTEPEGEVEFLMTDSAIEIDLQGKARSLVFNDGSDVELGFKVLPLEPPCPCGSGKKYKKCCGRG